MNSTSGSNEDTAGQRGGDRRQRDRRKSDRRAPLPLWRRPWAYAGYGVAAALVLVLLFSLGGEDGNAPAATAVTSRTPLPAVDSTALTAASAVTDAYTEADFAALLAEGEAAQGRRVRTRLYCRPIRQVALRTGSGIVVSASVAEQADAAGQVPAADCQWGGEASAPEVLLIVPPALAGGFASTPEVELGFVRRREVPAEVEWIGRSVALALRNVVVLREIQ